MTMRNVACSRVYSAFAQKKKKILCPREFNSDDRDIV